MKKSLRIISFPLIIIILCTTLVLPALAATTYYETNKDSVPIRSSYSADAAVVRTVAKKGTVVHVVSSTTNSAGNLWYKTSDGCWVFSGNLASHTHKYTGGICTSEGCGYEYPLTITNMNSVSYITTNAEGAPVWSRPYSNNSSRVKTLAKGTMVTVTARTTNQAGNLWYRMSDGNWVFSGNVEAHTHSYSGGLCSCGAEYPLSITTLKETEYTVTNASGAPVWNRPYSNNSTTVRTQAYNSTVVVVAKTTNQAGNLWYKLKDGNWIFSGNVAVKHTHQYSGGICSECGDEYPLTIETIKDTRYKVTNKDGAPVWNRPYSNNSTRVRTQSYDTEVIVVAKTTNQAGNLWYKLNDGNWIYSGNVSSSIFSIIQPNPSCTTHKYTSAGGDYCTVCNHLYEPTYVSVNKTYYVPRDGIPVWSAPYSKSGTVVKTLLKDAHVTVTKSFLNSLGNLWYATNEGLYIFSDNLTSQNPFENTTITISHDSVSYYAVKGYKPEYQYKQTDYSKFVIDGKNVGCTATAEAIAVSMYREKELLPSAMRWSNTSYAGWGHSVAIKGSDSYSVARRLSELYSQITKGVPVIFRVTNHSITVVGLRVGADKENLKTSDFLIVDAWNGKLQNLSSYLSSSGKSISTTWSMRTPTAG